MAVSQSCILTGGRNWYVFTLEQLCLNFHFNHFMFYTTFTLQTIPLFCIFAYVQARVPGTLVLKI